MSRVFVANIIHDMNMGALQQWGSPLFLFDGPVIYRDRECLVPLYEGGRVAAMVSLAEARGAVLDRVQTFNAETDFLALAGCPVHYTWVAYALCKGGVSPQVLKWSGNRSCYFPVPMEA